MPRHVARSSDPQHRSSNHDHRTGIRHRLPDNDPFEGRIAGIVIAHPALSAEDLIAFGMALGEEADETA